VFVPQSSAWTPFRVTDFSLSMNSQGVGVFVWKTASNWVLNEHAESLVQGRRFSLPTAGSQLTWAGVAEELSYGWTRNIYYRSPVSAVIDEQNRILVAYDRSGNTSQVAVDAPSDVYVRIHDPAVATPTKLWQSEKKLTDGTGWNLYPQVVLRHPGLIGTATVVWEVEQSADVSRLDFVRSQGGGGWSSIQNAVPAVRHSVPASGPWARVAVDPNTGHEAVIVAAAGIDTTTPGQIQLHDVVEDEGEFDFRRIISHNTHEKDHAELGEIAFGPFGLALFSWTTNKETPTSSTGRTHHAIRY
jgi:hypothetical protein